MHLALFIHSHKIIITKEKKKNVIICLINKFLCKSSNQIGFCMLFKLNKSIFSKLFIHTNEEKCFCTQIVAMSIYFLTLPTVFA